jgi:phosphoribosylaminoimidazole-succinocarboxamide synthase
MKLLYEGKSKKVFELSEGEVFIEFKDEVTAFNAQVRDVFEGKGYYTFRISSLLFELLKKEGIPTHHIEDGDRGFRAYKVKIIPVEVVIRNRSAGSIVKRLGIPENTVFEPPLIEFFYKSDELGDPLICKEHIIRFGWMKEEEIKKVEEMAFKATRILTDFFAKKDLILVDIKYEFGYRADGEIVLADEISPDTFRVWTKRGESLDKDVFRKDRGNVAEVYRKLYEILTS